MVLSSLERSNLAFMHSLQRGNYPASGFKKHQAINNNEIEEYISSFLQGIAGTYHGYKWQHVDNKPCLGELIISTKNQEAHQSGHSKWQDNAKDSKPKPFSDYKGFDIMIRVGGIVFNIEHNAQNRDKHKVLY